MGHNFLSRSYIDPYFNAFVLNIVFFFSPLAMDFIVWIFAVIILYTNVNFLQNSVFPVARSLHSSFYVTFPSRTVSPNHNLPDCVLLLFSCEGVSNSLQCCELEPARLLCPWGFPGKNTGVGCRCLLHQFSFSALWFPLTAQIFEKHVLKEVRFLTPLFFSKLNSSWKLISYQHMKNLIHSFWWLHAVLFHECAKMYWY